MKGRGMNGNVGMKQSVDKFTQPHQLPQAFTSNETCKPALTQFS